MTDPAIYERFDRATQNITATALLWQGKPVGRVVIKFGAAATAYVQIWGASMATARATGYGYDKASQAVMSAILAMPDAPPYPEESDECHAHKAAWLAADNWNGGTRWQAVLEDAGFTVCNVI